MCSRACVCACVISCANLLQSDIEELRRSNVILEEQGAVCGVHQWGTLVDGVMCVVGGVMHCTLHYY